METKTVESARGSARNSARSNKATGRDSARESGRGPESSRSSGFPDSARSGAMISSRPTMSTARVHTSLAALSAERSVLESRLALIDAALEQEKTKIVIKSKPF